MLDRSARVTATDYVWDFPNDASGITVGVIDAGIQRSHNHFSSSTVFYAHDYADGDNVSEAGCGESNCSDDTDNDGDGGIDEGTHGVHVAGIISGQSTFNNRFIKGISYDATLVIQRKFDSNENEVGPSASADDIWINILDPDNDGNYFETNSADVISNSWGSLTHGSYTSSSKEVDRVVKGNLGRPVPVVFAAGNEHPTFGVTSIATAKNVITVGASGDFKNSTNTCQHGYTSAPSDLNVMSYSSRETNDGRTSSVINNTYNSWDGTSMATPHVSAVAAQLLKQYNLTPYAVKAFLLSSTANGSRTNNYPNNINYNQGWGRLDAYRAVYKLSDEYTDSYDTFHIGEPGSGFSSDVYYDINVPVAADRLIVTLVWDDLPGDKSGNNSKTLYNDIDLYFRYPNGSIDTSTKEDDTINNVEKYIFNDPVNGIWEAHVSVIDLNGTAGTQNYSISIVIEKETTTPQIVATLSLNQTMIKPSASAAVSTRVNANGNMFYDIDADLDVSSGLTITSGTFDGTDGDKDKVGDIPAGSNRYTRNWTVRGDSVGSRTVTANVNGFRIDGLGYSDSDVATLTVCNDDDNDGYFLNSCGGNDCNDNNANVNPGSSEICDSVDNNCNGIVDEVCTPIGLTIVHPVNNAQYQSNTTDLNWTSNTTLASCYYKFDESSYSNIICRSNYSYSGFSFSVATQDTSPEDVTKKGNNFYVVGRFNEAVYEYDSSGTYTGFSFSTASQDVTPLGIAWNGSKFYVVGDATDKIYEYDSSGTYTGFSFSVAGQDTGPSGITTKSGSFFVIGDATDRVYEYNPAGTYTGFNFSVTNQDTGPEGIVWDEMSFYVVGAITDKIYEYYSTGNYTGFNFSISAQDTNGKGITTNGSSFFIVGATGDKVYKYISNNAALSNTTLNDLSVGKHNVTIYGKGSDGNTAQTNYTYFNITTVQPDTTPPIVNT
ncbi:S8 family serine peptidase, partial [Candidatus Woesearchaeota archaeon]|nr:S8 family serine peptidase [Candidatus Woesearchaeota archaeon]